MLILYFKIIIYIFLKCKQQCVNSQDPPEYVHHLEELMKYSAKQAEREYKNVWKIPTVTFNPAFAIVSKQNHNIIQPEENLGVFIWNTGYSCNQCPSRFMFAKIVGNGSVPWEIVNKGGEVESVNKDSGQYEKSIVNDPRFYMLDEKLFIIYWLQTVGKLQEMFISKITVDFEQNYFRIVNTNKLSISHEGGAHTQHSQKNWVPFSYTSTTLESNGELTSETCILYVHSAFPHHRIVHGNETVDESIMKVHTVALTSHTNTKVVTNWEQLYGPVHGGSNALLVDTKYGLKYLTFFHSQSHWMIAWDTTYWMGAYLFDAQPPFAVTHFTADPIIPEPLYNENTEGWAFRAMDYIVFPMSLLIRGDDQLFLILGHNDKSGWVMEMSLNGLVEQLTALEPADVLIDRFSEHNAISNNQKDSNGGGYPKQRGGDRRLRDGLSTVTEAVSKQIDPKRKKNS